MKKSSRVTLAAILLLIAPLSRSLRGSEDLRALFENGETAKILEMLAADPQLLKADLEEGMTPLHYAVYYGCVPIVDYALKNGVDLNIKDRRGLPPVWFSVSGSRPAMLRKLIALGADAVDVVKLLVARGVDLKAASEPGFSILHHAALRGYTGIVETLLARSVPKNAKDKNGYTALSYALKYGNRSAAEVLRKNGVEDVPWESNLDDAAYLGKPLKNGEAYIWYLRHSGWAIKTKSAVLVFDCWDNLPSPDEKLLANGHVNPEELKGYPVYVFVSHEHPDHFDPRILEWKKTIPNTTYIFGFEPEAREGIVVVPPRVRKTIGPLTVTTIKSNDAGVGYAVQMDGLTIFHAGDHSNNKIETADNDFFPEIDDLAANGIRPDVAFFLNMYGCGSTNPAAFQKGIFYAVDKLKIKAVLPMHGADMEWVYGNLAEGVAKAGIKLQAGAAVNRGGRFFYRKGRLIKS